MRSVAIWLLLAACPQGDPGFAQGDDDDSDSDRPASCADRDGLLPVTVGGADFDAWCEGDLHGGGWMLLLVSSDDGQDTWTWDARELWGPGGGSVGGLHDLGRDLRSPALGLMDVTELLFVHRPSDVTAVYPTPGSGPLPLQLPTEPDCSPQALPLAAGDLPSGLCDPSLYLSPADLDGADCDVPAPHRSDAWGPAWSVGGNDGCPLDDVGETGSLGPSSLEDPSVEYGLAEPAVGFGRALGLNTGAPGSGENRMEVYGR